MRLADALRSPSIGDILSTWRATPVRTTTAECVGHNNMGKKKSSGNEQKPDGKAEERTGKAEKRTNKKKVAEPTADAVGSISTSEQAAGIPPTADAAQPQENKKMNLTLKGLDKRGRNAIYHGAAVSLRIPINAFPEKTAPATLEVSGLAEKVARTPRAKLTKEERAALPKPTLAEKIAKREEALAKLKAKAEADAAAAAGGGTNQPAL